MLCSKVARRRECVLLVLGNDRVIDVTRSVETREQLFPLLAADTLVADGSDQRAPVEQLHLDVAHIEDLICPAAMLRNGNQQLGMSGFPKAEYLGLIQNVLRNSFLPRLASLRGIIQSLLGFLHQVPVTPGLIAQHVLLPLSQEYSRVAGRESVWRVCSGLQDRSGI